MDRPAPSPSGKNVYAVRSARSCAHLRSRCGNVSKSEVSIDLAAQASAGPSRTRLKRPFREYPAPRTHVTTALVYHAEQIGKPRLNFRFGRLVEEAGGQLASSFERTV